MIGIDIICKVSLPQFYMDRSNISNFSSDRNCRIKRKDEKFLFYSKIKFHMVNATSKLLPFYTRIKQYREILIYILLSSMANGAWLHQLSTCKVTISVIGREIESPTFPSLSQPTQSTLGVVFQGLQLLMVQILF